MYNCGTLFIVVASLIIIFMSTSSRRQNVCSLISMAGGIFSSLCFYFMDIAFNFNLDNLIYEIKKLFAGQIYMYEEFEKNNFAYVFLLIMIFFAGFIIFEIFSNLFVPKYNYFEKKSGYYFGTKIALIFVNINLFLFISLIIIVNSNYIYHIPEGFFKPVMELIREGLFSL